VPSPTARRERGGQTRTGKHAQRVLKVRLDDDEWAALLELAGDETVSDYVRRKIFGKRKSR
jgi:hypothetical protein